jgi:hypothetical protein
MPSVQKVHITEVGEHIGAWNSTQMFDHSDLKAISPEVKLLLRSLKGTACKLSDASCFSLYMAHCAFSLAEVCVSDKKVELVQGYKSPGTDCLSCQELKLVLGHFIFTDHKKIAIAKLLGGCERRDESDTRSRKFGLADPHAINKTFNRQIAALVVSELDRIKASESEKQQQQQHSRGENPAEVNATSNPLKQRREQREQKDAEITELFARALGRGLRVTKQRVCRPSYASYLRPPNRLFLSLHIPLASLPLSPPSPIVTYAHLPH